ncbi:MAG: hypothetical protein WC291_09515 [Thermodesulfovibrionales bacterium]|jgi:hypothetical protein
MITQAVKRVRFDGLARKTKREEKKAERRGQREAVLALVGEVNWTLCCFCCYAEFVGSACDDGYSECHHPLSAVEPCADNIDPDSDCWGFRLMGHLTVSDVADIVGLMLYRFDPEKTTYRIEQDDARVWQVLVRGFEQKAYKEARMDELAGLPPGYGAAHMGFPD